MSNLASLISDSLSDKTSFSTVQKFGKNTGVPNGSYEPVVTSGALNVLTAATTVRIKAGGNAADDAAGAGAREIKVAGLDSTGAEAEETITTAGISASSATTTSFIRVFRAYVTAVGTVNAANTADIVIENSGGGTDLITIEAGFGQTEHCAYTIPLGKTGYLKSVRLDVDSNKTADFKVITRESILDTAAPYQSERVRVYSDGVAGGYMFSTELPIATLPALTDIWVEASGSGATAEVSANLEILMFDA